MDTNPGFSSRSLYGLLAVPLLLASCMHRTPPPPPEPVDPTGIQWVRIPAGTFEMGNDDVSIGSTHEAPAHTVSLDAFEMSATEVTVAQFNRCVLAGACADLADPAPSPKEGKGDAQALEETSRDDFPVVGLSWEEAVAYAAWAGGRLPTEAEWEYAAAGGESHVFSGSDEVEEVGWIAPNSDFRVHEVGGKAPNAWGLYDMSGNVFEWVSDWYHPKAYSDSSTHNPQGPSTNYTALPESARVMRGGAFFADSSHARVTARNFASQNQGRRTLGFRVVRDLP